MYFALGLLPLVASVAGHSIFQEVYVNGASAGYLSGIRIPNSNNPVMNVSTDDIICNTGLGTSSTIITIPAGASVTTEWHHGLNKTPVGDADDPIAASHKGPVITYLASVSNAASTGVTGLKWFKIFQDGYTASTTTWGVDKLIANGGKVTFTLPSCIKAGQYLMRHEVIALHGASSYPGAQFYMSCAQIQVTGSGTFTPSSTVSFPGAYAGTDPGITLSIYWPVITNYTVPGPSVITC